MTARRLVWVGGLLLVLVSAPLWLPTLTTVVLLTVALVSVLQTVLLMLGRLGYWWLVLLVVAPALTLVVRARGRRRRVARSSGGA